MNDIIKMVELPEKLGILLDGAIKTVKHEIKEEFGFFIDKCYNWRAGKG